ncbi:MAG: hypothetical protein K8F25_02800 [Fimbriimonadaceae bacterium]|nr:hypothetical protein [Alphaproteobacteria bacterium]
MWRFQKWFAIAQEVIGNLAATRAFAFAISASRFSGGWEVSRESISSCQPTSLRNTPAVEKKESVRRNLTTAPAAPMAASVDQAQLDPHTLEFIEKMMTRFLDVFTKTLAVSAPYKSDPEKRKMKVAELPATYSGLVVLIKANMPEPALRSAVMKAISSLEKQ